MYSDMQKARAALARQRTKRLDDCAEADGKAGARILEVEARGWAISDILPPKFRECPEFVLIPRADLSAGAAFRGKFRI